MNKKLDWFGAGETFEAGEWAFDFRVGGVDVAEGTFHDGPVLRYRATYTDNVEHVRIVTPKTRVQTERPRGERPWSRVGVPLGSV